jgi:hypothetical protein
LDLLNLVYGPVAGSCEASIALLDSSKSKEFYTGEDLVTFSHCESFSSSTSTIQETDSVLFSPNKTNGETFFSYFKVWRQDTCLLYYYH